jgi:hypothetical protein
MNKQQFAKELTPGINALIGLSIDKAREELLEEQMAAYKKKLLAAIEEQMKGVKIKIEHSLASMDNSAQEELRVVIEVKVDE